MGIFNHSLLAAAIVLSALASNSASTTTCQPSGILIGLKPPSSCNTAHDSSCCVQGADYPTYTCSPPATNATQATLTVNGFQAGEDGGSPAECDGLYHSDSELIVALSTGWYAGGARCGKSIAITYNGKTVLAKVVDECDSTAGCDAEHSYQPPCTNNDVDASPGVWAALGVSTNAIDYGDANITWEDVTGPATTSTATLSVTTTGSQTRGMCSIPPSF
ncbi:hypothetical protein BDK51DRAFT_20498 [Blyttiomyces helicus]|uniref:RlpA-like double-psi beta-barrel-protein domain-containing protein-containing protein n=1 Tax=Blyttiomyces helicus TaxID=388810 RepID=A0A4P9WPM3_9FUNG|nr:hypothetical protein BDK51DRAFT_20498 [Blyttiomyces helicus]|eukprot:RKO94083.1 hypothetical protein BDK51DRAFT_20498 [Blyttiomyces helicus]